MCEAFFSHNWRLPKIENRNCCEYCIYFFLFSIYIIQKQNIMNIVKKKAPRLNFNKKEEPQPQPEVIEDVFEEVEVPKPIPEAIKMEVKEETPIFNTVEIPEPKKKKKRVLSQKQLDHLARCREKALAKKKALKEIKEKENAGKKLLKQQKKEEREEKLRLKKETDAKIRSSQVADKRKKKKEMMFECLDEWYAKKQERKKATRAKKTVGPTLGGASKPQPKATPTATAPKFRNEWKDPYCNSKFSPFNATFTRKKTKRGYMNY
tara:strand:+ start:341 stop:1132 length:792 start_codon:yes stop_codon:yes gene_type:complete